MTSSCRHRPVRFRIVCICFSEMSGPMAGLSVESESVKGSRTPAIQGWFRWHGWRVSEKPQGRKPRAGLGSVVRAVRSMGI